MASTPARLVSDDGKNVVIRPLIYCAEATLAELARQHEVPILPCSLCGSQPNTHRKQMRTLIERLEADDPRIRHSMLAAIGNPHLSHLLVRPR